MEVNFNKNEKIYDFVRKFLSKTQPRETVNVLQLLKQVYMHLNNCCFQSPLPGNRSENTVLPMHLKVICGSNTVIVNAR